MKISFRMEGFLVPVLAFALAGCPTIASPHDFASGWVGAPIETYLQAVDRSYNQNPKVETSREEIMRTRYKTANGNWVYVNPVVFNRCKIHWEVDKADIIVGYSFEEAIRNGCHW